MTKVLILIPPSEGKTPEGQGKPLGRLDQNAQVVYERLTAYKDDQSYLYGVKGKALEAAIAANRELVKAPTMPAIERYSGVVYNGIGYNTLSADAQAFFNEHVRIVSALFGLLKPSDPIPDYKLKMEKLDAAKHWQPIIASELKGAFVIDLLPQAHQKSVNYREGTKVDFIVRRNGKVISAGHDGKLIKGKFVRWLCENKVTDPQDFRGFKTDGFSFNGCNFVKG